MRDPEDNGEEIGIGGQTELECQRLLRGEGEWFAPLADLKRYDEDVLEGDIPVRAPMLELHAEKGRGSDEQFGGGIRRSGLRTGRQPKRRGSCQPFRTGLHPSGFRVASVSLAPYPGTVKPFRQQAQRIQQHQVAATPPLPNRDPPLEWQR